LEVKISLITGGAPHYEQGLVSGLAEQPLEIDVIGGDELGATPVMHLPRVHFKNLHGTQNADSPFWLKLARVFRVYLRIICYSAMSRAKVVHIQWPYKFVFLDRTVLNLYYKALGKKIVFTAHNIDGDARDGTSSWSKRFSLRFLYRIVDHIIVHTDRMKSELVTDFGIRETKISVIPHGVMSAVPESSLDGAGARKLLKIGPDQRVVLFFGLITPYKGLENLVEALGQLRQEGRKLTLLVVGRIKECPEYWEKVRGMIERLGLVNDVITELKRVPDESVEIYFKAADVLVLPYRSIFQSGVLFLTYRFGLPLIATDVGSFKEDIIRGKTGFVCRADDSADMAKTINEYFDSDLFADLENKRREIREYAYDRYSWSRIGEMTRKVYEQVLHE
jgi:D-inositol-3-phosphate glycosyltransferase